MLVTLLGILVAVLLERATRKTSANSSLPPSQMEDGTARRGSGGDAGPNPETGANLRRTTVEETVAVETCDACGADLSGVDTTGRERRVLYDIVFEVVERRVDAEIKECPACRARTKGRFPDGMPAAVRHRPAGLHRQPARRPHALAEPSRWSTRPAALRGHLPTSAACTARCGHGRRSPSRGC